MSDSHEKDKQIEEQEEVEEEYVLLELGDCLYSDLKPGAQFVLSVSRFFSQSTSLCKPCMVLWSFISWLIFSKKENNNNNNKTWLILTSGFFFVCQLYFTLLSSVKSCFSGVGYTDSLPDSR